jgi:hypothetical protein
MTRRVLYLAIAILLAAQAQAETRNRIYQHNPNLLEGEDNNYGIAQADQAITIYPNVA